MWKSEYHILTPKHDILRSLVPLVNHYFLTMEKDDNISKMTCKWCNGFVICKCRGRELLYINFLRYGLSNLVLYPEELDTEKFHIQWPARTKMQRMYQDLLKEGNGDHNFLRCPDL